MSKEYTWEDVVRECEEILQLNGHAESPLMSNLPNIIRDLVYKITALPTVSQQVDSADAKKLCRLFTPTRGNPQFCKTCEVRVDKHL